MSEVDAKIAAAEARTDTKFAQMMGELKVIENSTAGLKGTILVTTIGTGIAVVGLVAGIFGWGSAMFGVGMDADSIARQAAQKVGEQTAVELTNVRSEIKQQSDRLNILIETLGGKVPEDPPPQFLPAPEQ
jgi:hypothetical protein